MLALELAGRLMTFGNTNIDDFRSMPAGVPRVMLELQDGRLLLIAGLTRDECRSLAPAFGELVSVTVTEANTTDFPPDHSFEAVCREFEVEMNTAICALCEQFYLRGAVAGRASRAPVQVQPEAAKARYALIAEASTSEADAAIATIEGLGYGAQAPTGEGEHHGMDYTRHATMLDFARAVWRMGRDAGIPDAPPAPDDVRAALVLDEDVLWDLYQCAYDRASFDLWKIQYEEAARRALSAQQEGGKP